MMNLLSVYISLNEDFFIVVEE